MKSEMSREIIKPNRGIIVSLLEEIYNPFSKKKEFFGKKIFFKEKRKYDSQ